MKLAAVLGIYNEEENLDKLIESLLRQTVELHEIVIVDDGSTDSSGNIIKRYANDNPRIKYIKQENAGPSSARNAAWKNSNADICFFTDGDCVPELNWVEELLGTILEKRTGAAGGTYKEIFSKSLTSRFIGMEISWKYKNIKGEVDVHGTYNLVVKREVLERIEGFDETYPDPSGEDWDLAYKVSRESKIFFNPKALVSQKHPESFWEYIKGQANRAYYRIKVYKDHPEKRGGDVYTSKIHAVQMALSGLLIPALLLLYPFFNYSYTVSLSIFLVLIMLSLRPFPYFYKKDKAVAFASIPIQLVRNFAWGFGALAGIIKFGL